MIMICWKESFTFNQLTNFNWEKVLFWIYLVSTSFTFLWYQWLFKWYKFRFTFKIVWPINFVGSTIFTSMFSSTSSLCFLAIKAFVAILFSDSLQHFVLDILAFWLIFQTYWLALFFASFTGFTTWHFCFLINFPNWEIGTVFCIFY